MSAFEKGLSVESQGLAHLVPHLKSLSHDGRFVMTNKGRLSKEVQKRYGDAFCESGSAGDMLAVEFKVETQNKYGTFFIEEYSNLNTSKNDGRRTPGWLMTLDADRLWYYFLDEGTLYSIDWQSLWRWLLSCSPKGIQVKDHYPLRLQSKYSQLNQTWGRSVPISDVVANVRTVVFQREDAEFVIKNQEALA